MALVIPVLLIGCAASSRDVTRLADRYPGGYQPDQTYRLARGLMLVSAGQDHWMTHTPKYLMDPREVSVLKEGRPSDHVVGTVPQGTLVRVVKLVAFRCSPKPLYWWDRIRPIAKILDGVYAGERVDLGEVSDHLGGIAGVDVAAPLAATIEPEPTRITGP